MKPTSRIFTLISLAVIVVPMVASLISCSEKELIRRAVRPSQGFISGKYNHFEGGVFFSDIALGLNVLWEASFQNGRAYKENLGFFVPGGLLISPNKNNAPDHARLNAFFLKVIDGKLYVDVGNVELQVLGIVHTHPDERSLRMPTPRNDYQYGFMGIHNYVMGHRDLFDAYKDQNGNEVYKRLGPRSAYDKLPFTDIKASLAANDVTSWIECVVDVKEFSVIAIKPEVVQQ